MVDEVDPEHDEPDTDSDPTSSENSSSMGPKATTSTLTPRSTDDPVLPTRSSSMPSFPKPTAAKLVASAAAGTSSAAPHPTPSSTNMMMDSGASQTSSATSTAVSSSRVVVKMVDFAYTYHQFEELSHLHTRDSYSLDEGYLLGLRNLISMFEHLHQKWAAHGDSSTTATSTLNDCC